MIVIGAGVDLEVEDGDSPPSGPPWVGYHNVVTSGSVTSTTADVDHPVTNVANPATHLFWRSGTPDGNDSFTKVLLHFDGLDAAITIIDHNMGGSAHTWTRSGNAQI